MPEQRQRKHNTKPKGHKKQASDDEPKRFHASGPRPLWSGTISFGLVSLPVNLYPANRPKPISLRMVDSQGTPLARRYFCERDQRVLDYDELVRGYEVEQNKFVVMEDSELDSLAPEKSQEIDLKRFVSLDEIDPIYFQRAYFMTPDQGVTKAYRLLAKSMQDAKRAGIATFVMRGKEYLVAIIAEKGILRAETLRFAKEVRSPEEINLPKETKSDARRVKTMLQAIDGLTTTKLEHDVLQDQQSQRLIARATEKLAHGEDVITLPEVGADNIEPEQGGEVIDLMQVIKQSLAEGYPPDLDTRRDASGTTQRKPAKHGSSTSKGSSGNRSFRKKAATQRKSKQDDTAKLQRLSRDELYVRAQKLALSGRSRMTKAQLIEALARPH